jgi:hypothetical protein
MVEMSEVKIKRWLYWWFDPARSNKDDAYEMHIFTLSQPES